MNEHDDRDSLDETWFDKLDAIITGAEVPTPDDDELLRLSAKLSDALSPLSRGVGLPRPRDPVPLLRAGQAHAPTGSAIRTFGSHSVDALRRAGQAHAPTERVGRTLRPKWHLVRNLVTIAAVLFVLFGVGGACTASSQVSAETLNAGRQIWQAATSFQQIDASSAALLSLKNERVRPLLPVELPSGTQSVEFGIIADMTDPHIFTAFVADYHIAEQDISVYERAVDLELPSSQAQVVHIGSFKGQLFQDNSGNSVLQWYQDGITCQMASTLPAGELIVLAKHFQPIANWQLIV
jgi:uncharacterized membrane protein YgdD (TMEM256/DUF423 family)